MPRSNPKPFEKSYPLMTLGRMLGLPLIMVSMVLVAFILVGCFEPRMSVDCVRGTTVTCTFEERTWINHKGPTTLALDDTEIDLERGHKNNTKLLILNRKDRSTAFPTGVNNAGANNVKREIDQFLANPSAPSLKLIDQGGPFPYERDGITFGNFDGLLPERPRGYYREYTVPTPGLTHRGARRIVTGGPRPGEDGDPEWYFWTQDHYESFERIDLRGANP